MATMVIRTKKLNMVSTKTGPRYQVVLAEEVGHHSIISKYSQKKVFALQSLRELLKRQDPHKKRIKYHTYAKEYIVWCFYRDGADCGRSDDATRCAVIKYVTAILLDGKVEVNGNTQKITQQQAQEAELIGKAHKLEDFLSKYFMIERRR